MVDRRFSCHQIKITISFDSWVWSLNFVNLSFMFDNLPFFFLLRFYRNRVKFRIVVPRWDTVNLLKFCADWLEQLRVETVGQHTLDDPQLALIALDFSFNTQRFPRRATLRRCHLVNAIVWSVWVLHAFLRSMIHFFFSLITSFKLLKFVKDRLHVILHRLDSRLGHLWIIKLSELFLEIAIHLKVLGRVLRCWIPEIIWVLIIHLDFLLEEDWLSLNKRTLGLANFGLVLSQNDWRYHICTTVRRRLHVNSLLET